MCVITIVTSIRSEILREIDFDDVIDDFVRMKVRARNYSYV